MSNEQVMINKILPDKESVFKLPLVKLYGGKSSYGTTIDRLVVKPDGTRKNRLRYAPSLSS